MNDQVRTPSSARLFDPDTSHQAASSVDVFRARALHYEILGILIDECCGLHDEAIRDRLTSGPHSESGPRTRRSELVDAGWLVDSGDRALMRSGRRSIVWTITHAGIEAWNNKETP